MKKRLTQKQEIFCLSYFVLRNATQAAIQAGYKPKTARFIASQNLTKVNIQARVEELSAEVKKIAGAAIMSVEERMEVLTEIARASMINFVEVGQDGAWFNIDETNLNNRAIQSVQSKTVLGKDGADDAVFIRVNLHDPTKAIDLLNKMDKLYSEGSLVQNNISRQVNVYVIDDETKDLLARVGERTRLIANGHENHQSIQGDSGSMDSGQETD